MGFILSFVFGILLAICGIRIMDQPVETLVLLGFFALSLGLMELKHTKWKKS